MTNKILPQHLERQAYVYIRQSSPRQVEQHLESQDLQYQLVQRAQALGWPAARIVVIDDDLGKSAISARQRLGFQSLVAAVGLGQVGLILVTDVSRLARNCQDWYHLLDLASLCGTLLSDASGIYDPRHYDDRLLLGLKGTFSEAQWYAMRSQLSAAQLNKARRGELALCLPVGYERSAEGQVTLTTDRQVQTAILLVFETFDQLGSVHAVLRHWRDHGLPSGHVRVRATRRWLGHSTRGRSAAGRDRGSDRRLVPARPAGRPAACAEGAALDSLDRRRYPAPGWFRRAAPGPGSTGGCTGGVGPNAGAVANRHPGWAAAHFRLRLHNRWRWFVQLPNPASSPTLVA